MPTSIFKWFPCPYQFFKNATILDFILLNSFNLIFVFVLFKVQVQHGHIMDTENHDYFLLDLEIQNKAALHMDRPLLQQHGLCAEINSR